MRTHLLPHKNVTSPERIGVNQAFVSKTLNGLITRGELVQFGFENLPPLAEQTFIALKHWDNADPLEQLKAIFDWYGQEAVFRIPIKESLSSAPLLGGWLSDLGTIRVEQKYKDQARTPIERSAYSRDLTITQARELASTPNGKVPVYVEGHRYPGVMGPIKTGIVYSAFELARLKGESVSVYFVGFSSTADRSSIFRQSSARSAMYVTNETFKVHPDDFSDDMSREESSARAHEIAKAMGAILLDASNKACGSINLPELEVVDSKH